MDGQKELIDKFLQLKRIAFVGVSGTASHFSRKLWNEFRSRGYDAVPVNPSLRKIEGVECFARVSEIAPEVEGAFIITPKHQTDKVIADCLDAAIRNVWIYGIRGEKDVNHNAIKLCQSYGINVITGFCPYMFLPDTSFLHRAHGLGWKLIGYYPR